MIIDSFTHIYPKNYLKNLVKIHPLFSIADSVDELGKKYLFNIKSGKKPHILLKIHVLTNLKNAYNIWINMVLINKLSH